MRLKRTFLAVTTILVALLGLNGCGSDSGSSVLQRDVQGIWSFYEVDDTPLKPTNALRDTYTPLPAGRALAYDGGQNQPIQNRYTQNLVLQLTAEGPVSLICDTCGQDAGGSRLYGKFLSINRQLLCTPDINKGPPIKSIPRNNWLGFYATFFGTQIEGTVTGGIRSGTCSTEENIGLLPGPGNCAARTGTGGVAVVGDNTFTSDTAHFTVDDVGHSITINGAGPPRFGPNPATNLTTTIATFISETAVELEDAPSVAVDPATWTISLEFPAGFRHPVEIEISGELQFEPAAFGGGFCKMVLTYNKLIFPDEIKGVEPPAACNAEEQRTGEFVLYKSGYQPTDRTSLTCATTQPPPDAWTNAPGAAKPGCGTRDAYRWGPIYMTESECLDTYVSPD